MLKVGPRVPCVGCPLLVRDALDAEMEFHYTVQLYIINNDSSSDDYRVHIALNMV